MALEPLLAEGVIGASHALAALAALIVGAVPFAAPKGTLLHRTLGDVWASLMFYIAIGSFWIAELQLWGHWSPIHMLSGVVIVLVPLAVWRTHRHDIHAHKQQMVMLFSLALVVTGLFTRWPGRVMHAVIFGS